MNQEFQICPTLDGGFITDCQNKPIAVLGHPIGQSFYPNASGYHSHEWRPTISAIPAIAFAFGDWAFGLFRGLWARNRLKLS
jgi:hypothetical protein